MTAEILHHKLIHCITEYDRKEQSKRSYNPHALPLYMQGVDRVEEALANGADLRSAITNVFTGRLLDRVLKSVDLPKSTDAEQRY